jgi:hypothetical protein
MANVILTPQLLTRLTLMNLGGYLNVCRNMSNDYTNEFGKKGRKVGEVFNVRKPQRFTVAKGLKYQGQAINQTSTPVKVDQVAQVGFEFDSVEKTLSLDAINETLAKPAAIALASAINAEAAAYATLNTFNAVGTPGTAATTLLTYLNAGDKLIQQGLPEGEELNCIVSRKMSSSFVDGSKSLFNDQAIVGKQMRNGRVVDQLGYNWFLDQGLYTHVVGPLGGSPTVNGNGQTQDGGNNAIGTLNMKGWTASAAKRLNQGDTFTIANVYSVHPQTRKSTGDLQQFVMVSDMSSDGSGNSTASIYPAITPSGQFQNVDSAPVDSAAITVLSGAGAGTSSPQGLLLHKNAFAFVSVPMENPEEKGVEMVSEERDPKTGIVLNFVRAFDIDQRRHINRFDVLYGFGTLYRELSCRIYN